MSQSPLTGAPMFVAEPLPLDLLPPLDPGHQLATTQPPRR